VQRVRVAHKEVLSVKTAVQTTFIDVDFAFIHQHSWTDRRRKAHGKPGSIAWLTVEAGIPAEGACYPNSVITAWSVNRRALPDVLTLERS